ncbi:MAG: NAD-dependent epimerase/dehydratase family protein [Acidobacteriota bacterium]
MNQSPSAEVVAQDLQYVLDSLREEFSAMAGKRLLITGGAGFLGYYLVQSVVEWNRHCRKGDSIELEVFDNFSRGLPDWLEALQRDSQFTLVRQDMAKALPDQMGSFDFMIHAASIASPSYYRKHPIETMDANVSGVRSLLEQFRQQSELGQGTAGFLFFSSSEIYGDPTPDAVPTPETYRGNVSCTGPRACYDEAKRFGETLCVNFARQFGLPVKVARPFNNYGPGLKITDRRALPDFARDIFAGRDVALLSNGSPRRTFCYVADAVIGYFKVLVKGKAGEAYNIGVEGPEVSIAEVAEKVVALARNHLEYEGRVTQVRSDDPDYLVDNPSRRCPDIRKARSDLGYAPSVSLDDGLLRTLLWYQDNQQAEDA